MESKSELRTKQLYEIMKYLKMMLELNALVVNLQSNIIILIKMNKMESLHHALNNSDATLRYILMIYVGIYKMEFIV